MEHVWTKEFFSHPTWCSCCKEFIWGVTKKQGYRCGACKMTVHKNCRTNSGPCQGENAVLRTSSKKDSPLSPRGGKPERVEQKEPQPQPAQTQPTPTPTPVVVQPAVVPKITPTQAAPVIETTPEPEIIPQGDSDAYVEFPDEPQSSEPQIQAPISPRAQEPNPQAPISPRGQNPQNPQNLAASRGRGGPGPGRGGPGPGRGGPGPGMPGRGGPGMRGGPGLGPGRGGGPGMPGRGGPGGPGRGRGGGPGMPGRGGPVGGQPAQNFVSSNEEEPVEPVPDYVSQLDLTHEFIDPNHTPQVASLDTFQQYEPPAVTPVQTPAPAQTSPTDEFNLDALDSVLGGEDLENQLADLDDLLF